MRLRIIYKCFIGSLCACVAVVTALPAAAADKVWLITLQVPVKLKNLRPELSGVSAVCELRLQGPFGTKTVQRRGTYAFAIADFYSLDTMLPVEFKTGYKGFHGVGDITLGDLDYVKSYSCELWLHGSNDKDVPTTFHPKIQYKAKSGIGTAFTSKVEGVF